MWVVSWRAAGWEADKSCADGVNSRCCHGVGGGRPRTAEVEGGIVSGRWEVLGLSLDR